MEIKKQELSERKTISGHFSQEFFMNKDDFASFLRHLADQVESEDSLKIKSDEWILPFPHTGQVKVDIDLDDDELEIEIEFKKRTGSLSIELESPNDPDHKEEPESSE
jgi:amphi-Trp domain-containing protein